MEEKLGDRLLRACTKVTLKAGERKQNGKTGSTVWDPRLDDQELVRSQRASYAILAITSKFIRYFE
jgi:hypothetical protein